MEAYRVHRTGQTSGTEIRKPLLGTVSSGRIPGTSGKKKLEDILRKYHGHADPVLSFLLMQLL